MLVLWKQQKIQQTFSVAFDPEATVACQQHYYCYCCWILCYWRSAAIHLAIVADSEKKKIKIIVSTKNKHEYNQVYILLKRMVNLCVIILVFSPLMNQILCVNEREWKKGCWISFFFFFSNFFFKKKIKKELTRLDLYEHT